MRRSLTDAYKKMLLIKFLGKVNKKSVDTFSFKTKYVLYVQTELCFCNNLCLWCIASV